MGPGVLRVHLRPGQGGGGLMARLMDRAESGTELRGALGRPARYSHLHPAFFAAHPSPVPAQGSAPTTPRGGASVGMVARPPTTSEQPRPACHSGWEEPRRGFCVVLVRVVGMKWCRLSTLTSRRGGLQMAASGNERWNRLRKI